MQIIRYLDHANTEMWIQMYNHFTYIILGFPGWGYNLHVMGFLYDKDFTGSKRKRIARHKHVRRYRGLHIRWTPPVTP